MAKALEIHDELIGEIFEGGNQFEVSGYQRLHARTTEPPDELHNDLLLAMQDTRASGTTSRYSWGSSPSSTTAAVPTSRPIHPLANSSFNIPDRGGERPSPTTGVGSTAPSPVGNVNFAWTRRTVHRLAPAGAAGFVLANGSISPNQSGEVDLVGYMIVLPGRLFCFTQAPLIIRN